MRHFFRLFFSLSILLSVHAKDCFTFQQRCWLAKSHPPSCYYTCLSLCVCTPSRSNLQGCCSDTWEKYCVATQAAVGNCSSSCTLRPASDVYIPTETIATTGSTSFVMSTGPQTTGVYTITTGTTATTGTTGTTVTTGTTGTTGIIATTGTTGTTGTTRSGGNTTTNAKERADFDTSSPVEEAELPQGSFSINIDNLDMWSGIVMAILGSNPIILACAFFLVDVRIRSKFKTENISATEFAQNMNRWRGKLYRTACRIYSVAPLAALRFTNHRKVISTQQATVLETVMDGSTESGAVLDATSIYLQLHHPSLVNFVDR